MDLLPNLSIEVSHEIRQAHAILRKKRCSPISYQLFFDFPEDQGTKKPIWVFRSCLTPSQEKFFANVTKSTLLQIKVSHFFAKKQKHYNLVSYQIISPSDNDNNLIVLETQDVHKAK